MKFAATSRIIGATRAVCAITATSIVIAVLSMQTAWSQTQAKADDQTQKRTVVAEKYIPAIWVDPDGCEHWVMDDGIEGYMTPHVTRDGRPVCRRGDVCGVVNTDQFFATNRYSIGPAGRSKLREFFDKASAEAFIIIGHTDSHASDRYNMRLSERRANAVAKVANTTGVRVVEVRGYGERQPKATNGTAAGRAKNRRVEIVCLR